MSISVICVLVLPNFAVDPRLSQGILLSQFRHRESDGSQAEARRAAMPMDGIVGSNVG
jgi:hypothetical protein